MISGRNIPCPCFSFEETESFDDAPLKFRGSGADNYRSHETFIVRKLSLQWLNQVYICVTVGKARRTNRQDGLTDKTD